LQDPVHPPRVALVCAHSGHRGDEKAHDDREKRDLNELMQPDWSAIPDVAVRHGPPSLVAIWRGSPASSTADMVLRLEERVRPTCLIRSLPANIKRFPRNPKDWTSVEFGSRLPYSPRLYTNTQICKLARELSLFALRLCTTSWQLAYRDRGERAQLLSIWQ
jgi:hypothetical protein